MDHERASRTLVRSVKRVRIPKIKGKVEAAVGIHPGRCHEVESLRRLEIALPQFGAKLT